MSTKYKKIAFLRSFTTDKPDPEAKETSVYNKKKPKKVETAAWMHVSSMTCRDFSKDTYGYRDKHFLLAEEGIVYELPEHLRKIYQKENNFQKTEFRKLPLQPGKMRNQGKRIEKRMHESSLANFTGVIKE